jgi:AcrR family transcriptional regulator
VAERDPKATKARILRAATREFSAKGVAGARVDAIAARAKVNKRMLYHYFGSKSDLFREVLRRELSERVNRSRERGGTRLERLVERQATHARDRDWVRLLLWEGLDRTTATAADPERERWYREWVEGLQADQDAGMIPADLDVAQLALTELALTMFPAAFPQLTRWITGRSVQDPQFVEDRQRFLAALGTRLYGSV